MQQEQQQQQQQQAKARMYMTDQKKTNKRHRKKRAIRPVKKTEESIISGTPGVRTRYVPFFYHKPAKKRRTTNLLFKRPTTSPHSRQLAAVQHRPPHTAYPSLPPHPIYDFLSLLGASTTRPLVPRRHLSTTMNHSSHESMMEPTMAMTEHGMMTSHSDHDHGSMGDDDSMLNVTSTAGMMDDPFCNGDGTVMLMGFQVSPSASCVAATPPPCVRRGCCGRRPP